MKSKQHNVKEFFYDNSFNDYPIVDLFKKKNRIYKMLCILFCVLILSMTQLIFEINFTDLFDQTQSSLAEFFKLWCACMFFSFNFVIISQITNYFIFDKKPSWP